MGRVLPHCALFAGLVITACGSDGDDASTAALIAGGGMTGPDVQGVLDIFVADGDVAVGGADVYLGAGLDTRRVGTTDSSGNLRVSEATLTGPQVVTVVAEGRVTATWYGVTGASVTVPVRVPMPVGMTATVQGTVPALASLPEPAPSEYYVGVVDFGRPLRMISLFPGPPIVQAMGADYPDNFVYRDASTIDADFSLVSRVGEPVLYVTILRGNDQGTPDDRSDDLFDVVGLGIEQDATVLSAGATVTGVELEAVAMADLTPTTVTVAGVPMTFAGAAAVPGIQLDATRGAVLYPTPFGRPVRSFLVPGPAVSGLNATEYWGIGRARNELTRQSVIAFQRDIASPDGIVGPSDIDVSSFIDAPSAITFASGAFDVVSPASAPWLQLDVRQAGTPVWDVLVLDGRTQLVAPSDITELPSGSVNVTVHALQVDAGTDFTVQGSFLELRARSTLANEPLTLP